VKYFLTDFANLKIKSIQFFGCAHRDKVCIYIHMDEYSYVYAYLRLYCDIKNHYSETLFDRFHKYQDQTDSLIEVVRIVYAYIYS
jgi:hypothetical protein